LKIGEVRDIFTFLIRKRLEEELERVVESLYYIHGLLVFDNTSELVGKYGLYVERDYGVFREFYENKVEKAYLLIGTEKGKLLMVYRSLGKKGYLVAISRKLIPAEVNVDLELLAKRLEKKL